MSITNDKSTQTNESTIYLCYGGCGTCGPEVLFCDYETARKKSICEPLAVHPGQILVSIKRIIDYKIESEIHNKVFSYINSEGIKTIFDDKVYENKDAANAELGKYIEYVDCYTYDQLMEDYVDE